MDQVPQNFKATFLRGSGSLFGVKPNTVNGYTPLDKSVFPKTRYYGSKLRLIEWISSCLHDVDFQSVLEPFGGTATVSLLFKSMGKDVTYNDALWSNQHIARAILSTQSAIFRKKEIINFPSTVIPCSGYITNNFKNFYFTHQENCWLDGAVPSIMRKRDIQFRSDLFYCLFQACLQKRPFNLFHRKNLYIRENCDQNTRFGNWRTWERPFSELMIRAADELSKAKTITAGSATILPPNEASELKPGYDLVYIDPPYLKKSKNDLHYEDRYHFLEGLSRFDDWSSLIDRNKKTKALRNRCEITDWNDKVYFSDRLFDLISTHRKSIIALSYATEGYPEVSKITAHFKSNFNNVAILTQKLSHALHKGKKDEVLIIGA